MRNVKRVIGREHEGTKGRQRTTNSTLQPSDNLLPDRIGHLHGLHDLLDELLGLFAEVLFVRHSARKSLDHAV